ncbi:MAG: hypothetical protein AAF656_03795 [Planctomycetota bacterium]
MLLVVLLVGLVGPSPVDGLAHPDPSVREASTALLWEAGVEAEPWLRIAEADPRPEVRRRAGAVRFRLENGLTPSMPEAMLDAATDLLSGPEPRDAAQRLANMPGGPSLVAAVAVRRDQSDLLRPLLRQLPDAVLPMIRRGDLDDAARVLALAAREDQRLVAPLQAVFAAESGIALAAEFADARGRQMLLTFEEGSDPEPLRALAFEVLADRDISLAFGLWHRVGDHTLARGTLPAPINWLVAPHYEQLDGTDASVDEAFEMLRARTGQEFGAGDVAAVLRLAGRFDEAARSLPPSLAFDLDMNRLIGDDDVVRELLVDARRQVGVRAERRELPVAWAAYFAALSVHDGDEARRWLAVIGGGGARPGPDMVGLDPDSSDATAQYLRNLGITAPEQAIDLLESLRDPATRAAAAELMLDIASDLNEQRGELWAALDQALPMDVRFELARMLLLGTADDEVVTQVADALPMGSTRVALLSAYGRDAEALAAAEAWTVDAPDDADAWHTLAGLQADRSAATSMLERAFVLASDADTAAAVALELSRHAPDPERWRGLSRLIALGEAGPKLRQAADSIGPGALADVLAPKRRMAIPLDPGSYEANSDYARAASAAGRHTEAAAALDDAALYLHLPGIQFNHVSGFIFLEQRRLRHKAAALWEAGEIEAALPIVRREVGTVGGDVDATIFWINKLDAAGMTDEADRLYEEQLAPVLAMLEQTPDSPRLNNHAAWLSASVDRRLDDALVWATRGVENAPEALSIRDTLAEVMIRRGNHAEGLAMFEQLVAERPLVAEHRERLAQTRALVAERGG